MRGAIRLFRAFGINVNIHVSFLLLLAYFFFTRGARGLFIIVALYVCVVMHELSHSLMAKRLGINVRDITLFPMGGVASLSRLPDTPKQEFLITIVGPLSNVALAAMLFTLFWHLPFMGPHFIFNAGRPDALDWRYTVALIPWLNVGLAVFNLIPAFPMDGGRVLRSALAGRMGFARATRIAVTVGHIFAVIFAIRGIMNNNMILVLIAVFVYSAASAEGMYMEMRERRRAQDAGVIDAEFEDAGPGDRA